MHQYNTFTSFGPAQHAFAAMIRDEPEHDEQLGAFYQAKRDRFREQLLTTRLKPLPVPGGYFQLVDYSAISDLPDTAFVKWLTVERAWPRSRCRRSTSARLQAALGAAVLRQERCDAGCGDRAIAEALTRRDLAVGMRDS